MATSKRHVATTDYLGELEEASNKIEVLQLNLDTLYEYGVLSERLFHKLKDELQDIDQNVFWVSTQMRESQV